MSISRITPECPGPGSGDAADSTRRVVLPPLRDQRGAEPKARPKRLIADDARKWAFAPEELGADAQRACIAAMCANDPDVARGKTAMRVRQQVLQKLGGYRAQDVRNRIFSPEKFVDLWSVLKKLDACGLACFYCGDPVMVLYEHVREAEQWTVERIDNARGHDRDNFEVACLACNLRRRTIHHERYLTTKRLRRVSKAPQPEVAPVALLPPCAAPALASVSDAL